MTTVLSKCPFAGDPYYDEATRNYTSTPRPGPRIKPEACEYAKRNQGSWTFSSTVDFENSSPSFRQGPRFSSAEGRDNFFKARGTVSTIIQGSRDDGQDKDDSGELWRSRAIKPEAQEAAELHKGGRMNLLLTNYGKNDVTPRPPPRVKPEANSNYAMSRGNYMNYLLHDPSKVLRSVRAAPRVKPEAEDIAMKNRGSMNTIMRTCTPRY